MCNRWTQERVHELSLRMKLTGDEQGEVAGHLYNGDIERARLTLVNILDDRFRERKVNFRIASDLYQQLGYSPLELVIIRWTMYDPSLGIGYRIKKADG